MTNRLVCFGFAQTIQRQKATVRQYCKSKSDTAYISRLWRPFGARLHEERFYWPSFCGHVRYVHGKVLDNLVEFGVV